MQDYTSSIYQAIRGLFSIFCNENTKACLSKFRMIRYYIRLVSKKTGKCHDQKRCSYEYNNFCTLLNPLTFRRSEEHTSELQSRGHLVCRLLLEKKKKCIIEKYN